MADGGPWNLWRGTLVSIWTTVAVGSMGGKKIMSPWAWTGIFIRTYDWCLTIFGWTPTIPPWKTVGRISSRVVSKSLSEVKVESPISCLMRVEQILCHSSNSQFSHGTKTNIHGSILSPQSSFVMTNDNSFMSRLFWRKASGHRRGIGPHSFNPWSKTLSPSTPGTQFSLRSGIVWLYGRTWHIAIFIVW